jgi:geranylgeranylglycerol-phosphate geranylgeranyltransferase
MQRLLALIEITRPHNMLAASLGVVAGYWIAGGRDAAGIWPAAVITALVTGAGNVINDWFDHEIDRTNKPRRPLPSGRLGRKAAIRFYGFLCVALTAASLLLLPLTVALIVIVWQAALYLYAARLKRALFAGNLLVASVSSSAFFVGALLAGRPAACLVPVAIAFVFVFSRELVKGAEDVDGDSEAGVRTVAVVLGVEKAVMMAATLMVGLALLLPLPTLTGVYGRRYFYAVELLVVPGLLGGAWWIVRRPSRQTYNRVSWLLKITMFFGILALTLG